MASLQRYAWCLLCSMAISPWSARAQTCDFTTLAVQLRSGVMPDYRGCPRELAARAVIIATDQAPILESGYSDRYADLVYDQVPYPGTLYARPAPITLRISLGPAPNEDVAVRSTTAAPGEIHVGDAVSLHFSIKNEGVGIDTPLPIDATTKNLSNVVAKADCGALPCELASLPADKEVAVIVNGNVQAEGAYGAEVRVDTSSFQDFNERNNAASVSGEAIGIATPPNATTPVTRTPTIPEGGAEMTDEGNDWRPWVAVVIAICGGGLGWHIRRKRTQLERERSLPKPTPFPALGVEVHASLGPLGDAHPLNDVPLSAPPLTIETLLSFGRAAPVGELPAWTKETRE